jgi:hypothetical protein
MLLAGAVDAMIVSGRPGLPAARSPPRARR